MRILFVTALAPYPSVTGGSQRSRLLWEALSRRGEVDLVLHAEWSHEKEVLGVLQERYGLKQYHLSPEAAGTLFQPMLRYSPLLAHRWARLYGSRRRYYAEQEVVARRIAALHRERRHDVVVARYFRCACRAGLFQLGPLAVDVDDIDWEVFRSGAEQPGAGPVRRRIFGRQERSAREIFERRMGGADLAWVTKESDRAKVPARTVAVLPNGVCSVHSPAEQPQCAAGQNLLFVGSFEWQPNCDGIRRFATAVLPEIRRRHPRARLRVVGTGGARQFREAMARLPGVDFIGYAEDVAAHYRAAQFAVVPVYFGGGSHVKILECFHFGLTCVVSPFAHRGYESALPDGRALLRGEDDARLAEACSALLEQAELRERLARAGMEAVERHFGADAFRARVGQALDEVLAAAEPARDR